MTANELRIGNWVYNHAGRPAQVTRIEEIKTPLCQPIPLTEEWLIKFGFVIEKDYDDEYGDLFNLPYFGGFYKIEDYYIPKPFYFADAFSYNFKLKYVHQLQNLYFALTNEELTIQ